MNFLKTLGVLLALALVPSASAGELHWYEIRIKEGATSTMFVGASPLEAKQIFSALNGIEPIILQSLRKLTSEPAGANAPLQWRPDHDGAKLYLLPESILYFYELTGDPIPPK